MVSSHRFGSIPWNWFALFRLAFAAASLVSEISLAARNNSPDHYAKGTAVTHSENLRFQHRAPTACKPIGFRFYFTPLTGVLFNFPSRYLFTIGRLLVFSLRRWFSQILAWFHLSGHTWAKNKEVNKLFAYETITRLGRPFQTVLLNLFESSSVNSGSRYFCPQHLWHNVPKLDMSKV